MKQSEVLVSALQSVRSLTKLYFSLFDGIDMYEQLSINGTKYNSAYWIAAHIVWAEHYLIVQGVGNSDMNIKWINRFALGSQYEKAKNDPDIKEVMETMEKVHAEAVKILNKLNDD